MDFAKRTPTRDYILLTLGVILVSIAAQNIYDPAGLVTGGVSGVGIMLRHLWGIPLWLSNTLINVPLFIMGYYVKGWKFIRRTFFATVFMSIVLMLLPTYNLIPTDNLFLSSIFGGILTGIGSGFVFVAMATTGGTDLAAAIIQAKLRQYSIPQVMQILDWIIVFLGIGMFGVEKALYAVISIYVFSKVSDSIIDGMHFAKCAFIVSEHSCEIADRIITEMDRGVTGVHAEGMYSHQDTKMLYCVVSKREVSILKDIVHELDPYAFMIVSDVREVHGEGFTRDKIYNNGELNV